MFCKHEWKEVTNIVLPSAWEQLNDDIKGRINKTGDIGEMFNKTHILIMSCEKCGKVYKSTVNSIIT